MGIPKPGLFLKNKDVWSIDFGEEKIDRKKVAKLANTHRGSVRIASGRYYTKEEYEARRKRILNTPLP